MFVELKGRNRRFAVFIKLKSAFPVWRNMMSILHLVIWRSHGLDSILRGYVPEVGRKRQNGVWSSDFTEKTEHMYLERQEEHTINLRVS